MATREDVQAWYEDNRSNLESFGVPPVGRKGRMNPQTLKAFESQTGESFDGYATSGQNRITHKFHLRATPKGGTKTVEVDSRTLRTILVGVGLAQPGVRGRLPKSVSDKEDENYPKVVAAVAKHYDAYVPKSVEKLLDSK